MPSPWDVKQGRARARGERVLGALPQLGAVRARVEVQRVGHLDRVSESCLGPGLAVSGECCARATLASSSSAAAATSTCCDQQGVPTMMRLTGSCCRMAAITRSAYARTAGHGTPGCGSLKIS